MASNNTRNVFDTLVSAQKPMTALEIAQHCRVGSEVVRNVLSQAAWAENVGKVEDAKGKRRAILWRWNGQPFPRRRWGDPLTCKTCRERKAIAKGECDRCYTYRYRNDAPRPQRKPIHGTAQISVLAPASLRTKLEHLAMQQQVSMSEVLRRLIEAA